MDWFINLIRSLFFFLDSIVYPLIGTAYNLFVDIANTTVFTDDIINMFAEKVYALLGVFMLFKVSFSIMTYIVNPDEFTDKTKGFSKMISNIVITLALLLLTPLIFSEAMDIQRIVLKDNIIGKIFSTSTTSNISTLDAGNTMSYETFKAFYHINTDRYPNCEGVYLFENTSDDGNSNSNNCSGSFPNYEKYKEVFQIAEVTKSVDAYMDFNLLNEKANDEEYVMTYMPLISTIAGGFICWILIVFCFDVAVRSIKLGFLRMIAPVPIISRIDPKKGKDVFDKWVKSCVSTYLDLFIRLLAIYFAVFVIGQVANMKFADAVTGDETTVNAFVKVFIIMGALLFAKQLPQLITELTGIKMDGKFTMNPLKKVAEVPGIGKLAHTAIGGADSMIHGNGFWSGVKRNWKDIPLMGGDGKTSILETSDRKMRRDIREKRDYAKQRYQGLEATRQLEEKTELGRVNYEKINGTADAAYKKAIEAGKTVEEATEIKNQAKTQAELALYGHEYYNSKKSVDDAKANMYAWKNKETTAEEIYGNAIKQYGADSIQAQTAFKQLEEVRQKSGTAQGQYEYRNKEHKNLKERMPEIAEIEDAIEAYEKMGGKKIGTADSYTFANFEESGNAGSSGNGSYSGGNGNAGSSGNGSYSGENGNATIDVDTTPEVKENGWYNHEGVFVNAPTQSEHDDIQRQYDRMFKTTRVNQQVDYTEQNYDKQQELNETYLSSEYDQYQGRQDAEVVMRQVANREYQAKEADLESAFNSPEAVQYFEDSEKYGQKIAELNDAFVDNPNADEYFDYHGREEIKRTVEQHKHAQTEREMNQRFSKGNYARKIDRVEKAIDRKQTDPKE